MDNTCIIPIVEGHGEVEAIRVLLSRVWVEMCGGSYIHVLKPLRIPKSKILKPNELTRYVQLAHLKLQHETEYLNRGILVLFDADEDLPCVLAGKVSSEVQHYDNGVQFSCVIANKEFETWFVASSDQMLDEFEEVDSKHAETAESSDRGKRWVEKHSSTHYSETADMPRMVQGLNLILVRRRSPSFDKLCREIELLKNRLGDEFA